MALERNEEEMARLERDLNEHRKEIHAWERNLYDTESVKKLDWRRETLISALKKELKTLRDVNEAVKKQYGEIVWLQACINARAMDTIHDKKALLSDKKAAQERLAMWGGSDDEVAHLRRTFIPLSPFYC